MNKAKIVRNPCPKCKSVFVFKQSHINKPVDCLKCGHAFFVKDSVGRKFHVGVKSISSIFKSVDKAEAVAVKEDKEKVALKKGVNKVKRMPTRKPKSKLKKPSAKPNENIINAFVKIIDDGVITKEEKDYFNAIIEGAGIKRSEALAMIKPYAESFFRKIIADVVADEVVTTDENELLKNYLMFLGLKHMVPEVQERFDVINNLQKIKNGKLPKASSMSPSWLKSGEKIYYHGKCRFAKGTGDKAGPSGKLYITDLRVEFLDKKGALLYRCDLKYIKKIMIESHSQVFLGVKDPKFTGSYQVEDANYLEALLECLLKSSSKNRVEIVERPKISAAAKNAVWVRDGGRCSQCSKQEFLEFEYITPPSQGGAVSSKNIHLVCKSCR